MTRFLQAERKKDFGIPAIFIENNLGIPSVFSENNPGILKI